MVLAEPFGLVIDMLGKTGGNVAFMMPKRIADTRPQQADHRRHGLGPLHLQEGRVEGGREGGLPQESQVQAAQRAALGFRRRQVAKVDRIEWIWSADTQTQ